MKNIVFVCCLIVAALLGGLLYQQLNKSEPPEHALYYQQPRAINAFQLTDHDNSAFNNESLNGNWSFVFFGYTSCPDVCPTTLQEINFVYPELKQVAENVQILLVSVDPNRDKPEKLAQYIRYFNSEFIALTGGHDVLFPFARNLGLMYAITEDTNQSSYLVDHSASIVLVNPDGYVAAIFKPTHEPGQVPAIIGENLVSDFNRIVQL